MNQPDLTYLANLIALKPIAEKFIIDYNHKLRLIIDYRDMLDEHKAVLEAGELERLNEWIKNLNTFLTTNLDKFNSCNVVLEMSDEQFKTMKEGYDLCLTQLQQ